MSTYEYQCSDCKHTFVVAMSVGAHETAKVECPQCKSSNVRRHHAPSAAATTAHLQIRTAVALDAELAPLLVGQELLV